MNRDKVVLLESLGNRETKAVMVKEDGTQEVGLVRAMEEGKPIHGDEIMTLSPTTHPLVYGVNERISLKNGGSKGPPKVATREYRKNYDQIFGSPESLPN